MLFDDVGCLVYGLQRQRVVCALCSNQHITHCLVQRLGPLYPPVNQRQQVVVVLDIKLLLGGAEDLLAACGFP